MVHIIHKQIFDAKVSYTMVSIPSVVLHYGKRANCSGGGQVQQTWYYRMQIISSLLLNTDGEIKLSAHAYKHAALYFYSPPQVI